MQRTFQVVALGLVVLGLPAQAGVVGTFTSGGFTSSTFKGAGGQNSIGRSPDGTQQRGVITSNQVTTAVRLIGFSAQSVSDGVWLSWRTGWESDNLGFHVYRQVKVRGKWQKAARLNPSLIAGSALLNGSNADPRGGFVCGWRDAAATPSVLARYGVSNVRYWLQDVDVRGKSVNHGPVSPVPGNGRLSGKRNSELVSALGG